MRTDTHHPHVSDNTSPTVSTYSTVPFVKETAMPPRLTLLVLLGFLTGCASTPDAPTPVAAPALSTAPGLSATPALSTTPASPSIPATEIKAPEPIAPPAMTSAPAPVAPPVAQADPCCNDKPVRYEKPVMVEDCPKPIRRVIQQDRCDECGGYPVTVRSRHQECSPLDR